MGDFAPRTGEPDVPTGAGDKPLTFGIIGCGAVTEKSYLPAFQRMAACRVTHLADLDQQRGQALADQFGIPRFTTRYEDLYGHVDAVVVATPPESHVPITLDCMAHNLHVLCEKPLTNSTAEVRRLMAARKPGIHVGVGMVRRMNPSARLMKAFVAGEIIGKVVGFGVEEGSEFNWPLHSPHVFRPNGFGGVLMDTGIHIFDILAWSLDAREIRIQSVRDDNLGGVEANIRIEVVMETDTGGIPGTIDLSFTRKLPNRITLMGERGKIEVPARGGDSIDFYLHPEGAVHTVVHDASVPADVHVDPFGAQIRAFADSIRTGQIEYVTIDQAFKSVAAIEACRAVRETEIHSWER